MQFPTLSMENVSGQGVAPFSEIQLRQCPSSHGLIVDEVERVNCFLNSPILSDS